MAGFWDRDRLKRMIAVLTISAIAIITNLASFPFKYERLGALREGMTLPEVEALLGEKGKVAPYFQYSNGTMAFRWEKPVAAIEITFKFQSDGGKKLIKTKHYDKSLLEVVSWFLPTIILLSVLWIALFISILFSAKKANSNMNSTPSFGRQDITAKISRLTPWLIRE